MLVTFATKLTVDSLTTAKLWSKCLLLQTLKTKYRLELIWENTFIESSIDRCNTPIPNLIYCKYSELEQVTWAVVGCSEAELWFIHTAVSGEWSSPPTDVVHLHTIPEVWVHSSDVQGEGTGPVEANG